MLGVDEAKQLQWVRREQAESLQQRRTRLLAEDLQSNQVTVEADNGVDITKAMAQMGRPLTCEAVINRLKKCNSQLIFERSINFPNLFGIYILRNQKKVHICGMEAGLMPEFTVVHTVKKRVPDGDVFQKEAGREVKWKEIDTYGDQTRGWRTVLVRLLHAGLVTRGDVDTQFGWTPSRDSKRWYEQTQ